MTVPSPWGCWACSQIATLSIRASFLPPRPFGRETAITQVVRPISASCSVVASFCTAAWVRMLMTTAGRCRSKYHQRDHTRQEPRRVPDTAPDLAGRVCHLACAAASTQGLLRGLPKQCRQTKRRGCRQGSPGAIHAHEVGYQGKHCEGKDHSAHFSGGK